MARLAAAGTVLPLLAHGRIGTAWSAGMVAASVLLGVGLLAGHRGATALATAWLMVGLPMWLLEALRTMSTSDVRMSLNTPTSPCVLTPVEEEKDEELVCLVMPLRLAEA